VTGPSQPFIPTYINMKVSSNSKDKKVKSEDLVSFFDVMDATKCAIDTFTAHLRT